jgi:hypothetical protein
MANNNNQSRAPRTIYDTTVDIEPVGVVYNIESDTIQQFLSEYFRDTQKIKGLLATRAIAVRDGNRNPEVKVYAFFDINSDEITSNIGTVPEHLRRKMDVGGFKASNKLYHALRPILKGKELKIYADLKTQSAYVELDIFRVLGLMLSVDPNRHHVTVAEVQRLKKKRAVLSVIKSSKFVADKGGSDFDKYTNIVSRNW